MYIHVYCRGLVMHMYNINLQGKPFAFVVVVVVVGGGGVAILSILSYSVLYIP